VPHLHLDLTPSHQHLVKVHLRHVPKQPVLRLSLPAWTPGSYLIRDYVRQLEGLELSQGGKPLKTVRTGPANWQVELADLSPVDVHYRLVATELTVRTCHLTTDHGFLALAAVALLIEGERWNRHTISLDLPPQWRPFVPLPEGPEGWSARDFDQLIDTPIEVGPHQDHAFAVAGVPHRWVSWGHDLMGRDLAADPQWLADVERVCLACCQVMGEARPAADAYLFVLHLTADGYGGLEHDSSTVLQFGRRVLAKPDGRRMLLQLVAHEYLHQWNVRRLRPAELTPYDYGQAVVVPSLWFAEGITSYLDQLLPHAAGVTAEATVLEDLGADLSRYLLSPGRAVQSLRASGQEAWVKLYKSDAYSANSQISYYLKGAVVALVLDLHLRREGACLPQVLQALWQSHGRWGRGYGEADLVDAFAAFSPALASLLPSWLESYDDPPLQEYLADVGLRLVSQLAPQLDLGASFEQLPGSAPELRLQRLTRHGPASGAGLMVGDELLAIDGERVRSTDDLATLLSPAFAGRQRRVLICRDHHLKEVELTPEPPAIKAWSLEGEKEASPAQLLARQRWLALALP